MQATSLGYRDMLKIKLADAIAANPSYSLRAMAKQIQVSPSLLSEVLSGKKKLSSERAFLIAGRLKFKAAEKALFTALVELEAAKSDALKFALLKKIELLQAKSAVQVVNLDIFRVISEWYHFPILELLGKEGFEANASNIANELGISVHEAAAALERLARLELVAHSAQGRPIKTNSRLLADSRLPNDALRKYHRQMLQKASDALDAQAPTERFIGSETFLMAESQLKEAEAAIEECFEKVVQIAAGEAKGKAVYHFGMQVFRLTKGAK